MGFGLYVKVNPEKIFVVFLGGRSIVIITRMLHQYFKNCVLVREKFRETETLRLVLNSIQLFNSRRLLFNLTQISIYSNSSHDLFKSCTLNSYSQNGSLDRTTKYQLLRKSIFCIQNTNQKMTNIVRDTLKPVDQGAGGHDCPNSLSELTS